MSIKSTLNLLATLGKGVAAGLPPASPERDPIDLFGDWFSAAQAAGVFLPEAFCLSTATPEGRPSSRMVLLKGHDARGFCFYTNHESRKAQELATNPQVSLCFHWPVLERQVRVEGAAARMSAEESLAYFQTRPRGSRIGAWASPQSATLPDRATFDKAYREYDAKYPGDDVPLPPYWGGYRVAPTVIEFWQGRASRLHDRLVFERSDPQTPWSTRWLYP